MRCKHNIWSRVVDFCNHLFDRSGPKRLLRAIASLSGFHHLNSRGARCGFKDLRPSIRKPAVAHHQDIRIAAKLAGHCLHPESATAGDQSHCIRIVNLFQHSRNIGHHGLKNRRHMV